MVKADCFEKTYLVTPKKKNVLVCPSAHKLNILPCIFTVPKNIKTTKGGLLQFIDIKAIMLAVYR